MTFYGVTRGRLSRTCPLALLSRGAELVLRSECVRRAYRLLLSLKFLSVENDQLPTKRVAC